MTEQISDRQHFDAAAAQENPRAPESATTTGHTAKARHRVPDSSYQNYLFGNAGSSENPAWSDSAKGRFAIRMLSRGVVGAAFFTWGGHIADKQLKGYEPTAGWNKSQPLQLVAKGIDMTLGRAIEGAVRGIAGLKHDSKKAAEIGRNAVNFRDTNPKYTYQYKVGHNNYIPMHGRSYGADIVSFTFDFAMASIGDAMTRNIIQSFDPNVPKIWKLNEQGDLAKKGEKWHIDWSEWLKSVGKSTWVIFSKNQGEDWAAAIPYAFQMKFQRKFLTKIFENKMDGHHLVFDHGWNGGAYKVAVDAAGKTSKIVGDYQLAGAIDLHARFTGYNWYTLMFREGWDSVGNAFNQWRENDYKISMPKLPEHFNPLTATVDAIGDSMRYVTKSFIKANLYMNPAVIPFWLFRVPQSKWRAGHFIQEGAEPHLVPQPRGFQAHSNAHYDSFRTDSTFDRFSKGFSEVLHPFGVFSNKMGQGAASLGQKVKSTFGFAPNFLANPEIMHKYMDAAISYTPYMYAKAEFGLRVDDNKGDGKPGQMDTAIYKFMDDVASLNFKAVPTDLKKIWKLGSNFERDIVVREGGPAPTVAANQTKPSSTVDAASVRYHDPALLESGQLRHVGDSHAAATNDSNEEQNRSWVKSVVGSDINPARIHSANHTRH